MDVRYERSTLSKLNQQRNILLAFSFGLLMVTLLQAVLIGVLLTQQKIIVTPPVVEKSFWVKSSQVSANYLSEMAHYFIHLRLDLTPETVTHQHTHLLRYTDPSFHTEFNRALQEEAERVRTNRVITQFTPTETQVLKHQHSVRIKGELTQIIGHEPLKSIQKTYVIQFTYKHGRLWVKDFDEVTSNE